MSQCFEKSEKGEVNMQDVFFKEEVRDEYLVTARYKRIWAIEIDILREIMELCDKHELTYFVYAGTLLGAVRHGGFIPWDDDLDVALSRGDYELFLKYAEAELDSEKFTLQKSETLGEIYEGFARIRDNHSTAIIKRDRNKNCNHGIFVDIYPLDNIPDDEAKRKKQFRKLKALEGLLYLHTYPDAWSSHPLVKKIVSAIKIRSLWERLAKDVKKECTRYNGAPCKKVGMLSCDPYDEKFHWYVEDICDTCEMPFEFLKVKVPCGYDRCLRIAYDEYMEFPPVEERGKWHGNIFFDPYQSFENYRNRTDSLFEN